MQKYRVFDRNSPLSSCDNHKDERTIISFVGHCISLHNKQEVDDKLILKSNKLGKNLLLNNEKDIDNYSKNII